MGKTNDLDRLVLDRLQQAVAAGTTGVKAWQGPEQVEMLGGVALAMLGTLQATVIGSQRLMAEEVRRQVDQEVGHRFRANLDPAVVDALSRVVMAVVSTLLARWVGDYLDRLIVKLEDRESEIISPSKEGAMPDAGVDPITRREAAHKF